MGLGVDDVLVEVDGPEVPILDGSAAPFVILIHEAGLGPTTCRGSTWRSGAGGGGPRGARPRGSCRPTISRSATASASTIRCCGTSRTRLRITPAQLRRRLAPARTFGFLREVETLRKHGLALGGSLENAVVIGETGVLNNTLRFEDEFVRHKILDAVGDLALLGRPLLGQLEAMKAGHALHAAVARKLLETPGAWRLVPGPGLPAPVPEPAPALSLRPSEA